MTQDEVFDLDLTVLQTRSVRVKIGDEIYVVQSDIDPIASAEAHDWLRRFMDALNDPSKFSDVTVAQGYAIATRIVGKDMSHINWQSLVEVLTFFRDIAWSRRGVDFSNLLSASPESSTEESTSDNSSEVPSS